MDEQTSMKQPKLALESTNILSPQQQGPPSHAAGAQAVTLIPRPVSAKSTQTVGPAATPP